MQTLCKPVPALVADKVVIVVVAYTKLTCTLTQYLLNKLVLVIPEIDFIAIGILVVSRGVDTLQADTVANYVNHLDGLFKVTSLCKALSIHQIHLIETEINPLGILAQIVLVHIILVAIITSSIS